MSSSQWFIKQLRLCNILGFYGYKEWLFHNGVQVIEAENHSGKTSLALALLWALTGQLPTIDRISAGQFKLKHKLAADKEECVVEIALANGAGELMSLRRSTKSSAKASKLSLRHQEASYEGVDAQNILSTLLGLKPRSMEGCCVVLQEQRLGLIAGDVKKSSQTIHDILGLSLLSKLVPIITTHISAMESLLRRYKDVDALASWNSTHKQLEENLASKECEAVAKGFPPALFKTSQFLDTVFNEVAKTLEVEVPADVVTPAARIVFFRDVLKTERSRNPHQQQVGKLNEKLAQIQATMGKLRHNNDRVRAARQHYPRHIDDAAVTVSGLPLLLQRVNGEIDTLQHNIDALSRQQGLFVHSMQLLQSKHLDHCPLCQQAVQHEKLLKLVQSNLDQYTHTLVDQQHKSLKALKERQAALNKLDVTYQSWEQEIRRIVDDATAALEPLQSHLQHQHAALVAASGDCILDALEAIATSLASCIDALNATITGIEYELIKQKDGVNAMEERTSPVVKRLDDVALYLMPVYEAQKKLIEHEGKKELWESRGGQFKKVVSDLEKYILDLKQFKEYIHKKESGSANDILKEHQRFVSDFFVKVAQNPSYDTITIDAEEDRGSVKYYFDASSTANSAFTDNARHVLSGGDLSCACLGLILSLTRGRSNKAGFLLLDDPGESLDSVRMENFANEIGGFNLPQTIILTHQSHFSTMLQSRGATKLVL